VKQIDFSKPITLVIGLGRSGIGAAKLLNSEGKQVVVIEQEAKDSFRDIANELIKKGIIVYLGIPLEVSSFDKWISNISKVVVSPGIAWDHETINHLKAKGIEVKGEIGIAWESLKEIPWVGITGTNGKTTVTEMLHHILKENQIIVPMGGNTGTAGTKIALEVKRHPQKKPKLCIMELSSYQLESTPEISPFIGIWTTLTPDHLERHKSIDKYIQIKRRLLQNSSIRIYNYDDNFLRSKCSILEEGIWISAEEEGTSNKFIDYWIDSKGKVIEKGKELLDSSSLEIPGKHNLQNLLLVIASARKIGMSGKQIEKGLETFKGVPHRLEKIGWTNNIAIFNDSKATNFDSAQIGLEAVNEPSVVIAGGQAKKGNFKDWGEMLCQRAIALILFGESAKEIKDLAIKHGFKKSIYIYENLNQATKSSIKIAKETKAKSILFSPACASFDQYKNFEERGDHFKEIVYSIVRK
tara:strand:- start:84 stop:1487 length:1404 start_codon:yes stop_codon:yes gene_type:complete